MLGKAQGASVAASLAAVGLQTAASSALLRVLIQRLFSYCRKKDSRSGREAIGIAIVR